jgi:hypothetical protein
MSAQLVGREATLDAQHASLAALGLKRQSAQKSRALDLLWAMHGQGVANVTCSELTREYNVAHPAGVPMHQGVMSRVIGDLRASNLVQNDTPRKCTSGTGKTVVPVRAVRRIGDVVGAH